MLLLRVKIPTQLTEKQKKIFQELSKEEEPLGDEKEEKEESSDTFKRFKDLFNK